MPKPRIIDPSFWEDIDIQALGRNTRFLIVAMITAGADDHGRCKANPMYLKRLAFAFDADVSISDVTAMIEQIRRCRNIRLYEVGGEEYALFKNWQKYQNIRYPAKSKLPEPPSENCAESEKNIKTVAKITEPPMGSCSVGLEKGCGSGSVESSVGAQTARAEKNPPPPQTAQAPSKPTDTATDAEKAVFQAWINARGAMSLSANDWPDLEALCREYGPEWVEHAILDADAGRNGGSISRNFVKAILERYHASGHQYPWLIPKGTRTQAQQTEADVEELRRYMIMQVDMGMSREEANKRLKEKLPGARPI